MEKGLKAEIESTRQSMVDVALKKGLSSEETINLSRKLDDLINQFNDGMFPSQTKEKIT